MAGISGKALLFVGVHVFAFIILALTAFAQEDGSLVGLHDLRVERGRMCMSDHFHVGDAQARPSRQIAEREALASWSGFTAWEYGDHWGNPKLAGSPSMKCEQSSGLGWSCQFNARPCRAASGRAVAGRGNRVSQVKRAKRVNRLNRAKRRLKRKR